MAALCMSAPDTYVYDISSKCRRMFKNISRYHDHCSSCVVSRCSGGKVARLKVSFSATFNGRGGIMKIPDMSSQANYPCVRKMAAASLDACTT